MWNKYILGEGQIKVQRENEFFTLYFEDLKTLEFGVEPGTLWLKYSNRMGFPVKTPEKKL